jgi:hypothetical protein
VPLSESQKGRVIEPLVGATLILQSNGALRASLPFVDDEGVDLVLGNRSNDKTLLLQIKGRYSLSGRGHYRANVRRATCAPNPNKYLLFVYYDTKIAALGETCWFIRSSEFCSLLSKQKETRSVYIFDSTFKGKGDMWVPFRIPWKDAATSILQALI